MPAGMDHEAELLDEATATIHAESIRLLEEARRCLLAIDEATKRENRALALWRRWFKRFGDPWFESNGDIWCCFCDGMNYTHNRGCVYDEAKELLEGAGA